jgi:hypothetical protein
VRRLGFVCLKAYSSLGAETRNSAVAFSAWLKGDDAESILATDGRARLGNFVDREIDSPTGGNGTGNLPIIPFFRHDGSIVEIAAVGIMSGWRPTANYASGIAEGESRLLSV